MSYQPTQYAKAKSPAKQILTRESGLQPRIHDTLKKIAAIVGATLGPGGRSVILERGELDTAPIITKDGVTVFRHLGFTDPAAQVIMEAARDAAVRTAQEAGDGTTTATILAYSLVDHADGFCETNPRYSPQRVVRVLEKAFREEIEPEVKASATKVSIGTPEGRERLVNVARVSANGDTDLAKAVLECFDVVGDEGNVTLVEKEGPSHYEVEQVQGYGLKSGYEHSTKNFYQSFINEAATQMCVLSKPLYILYYGILPDLDPLLKLIGEIMANYQVVGRNVVIAANGFGDQALARLAASFVNPSALNVFPLKVPITHMQSGQWDTLYDLAAVTGGKVLDMVNLDPRDATINDLGTSESFEAGRFRSSVIGYRDEILIEERARDLKKQIENAETSALDKIIVQERLGKLTSGLAKLKIFGSSAGELREKRDRAEDAVCGVRGALKHGILPGGGYVLARLWNKYRRSDNPVLREVLAPSLRTPVETLFTNSGYSEEETSQVIEQALITGHVYDLLEGRSEPSETTSIVDSTPAVVEAIRNSLSIASLLGTCGGTVVFYRDGELDKAEARAEADWQRNANDDEANDRW